MGKKRRTEKGGLVQNSKKLATVLEKTWGVKDGSIRFLCLKKLVDKKRGGLELKCFTQCLDNNGGGENTWDFGTDHGILGLSCIFMYTH